MDYWGGGGGGGGGGQRVCWPPSQIIGEAWPPAPPPLPTPMLVALACKDSQSRIFLF